MSEWAPGSRVCFRASELGHPLPSGSITTWGGERGGLARSPYASLPGHTQLGCHVLFGYLHAQWKSWGVTKCVRIYTKRVMPSCFRNCETFLQAPSQREGHCFWRCFILQCLSQPNWDWGAMCMHCQTSCHPLGSYLSRFNSTYFKSHSLSAPDTQGGRWRYKNEWDTHNPHPLGAHSLIKEENKKAVRSAPRWGKYRMYNLWEWHPLQTRGSQRAVLKKGA